MRISPLKELARKGNVFTFTEFMNAYGLQKNVASVMLNRFEKEGWIERFGKARYIIIPLESEKGKYTLHEFVMGSFLVDPYCIGYWSALNYYGLTEQIPSTVFVQTTSRKKKLKTTVFGVNYQFVHLKENKFFGLGKRWFDRYRVNVTNLEKTVVDCLDKPQYCGGVIEVAKALKTERIKYKADRNRLIEYAKRMGNSGVIRRLGYLCQKLDIPIDMPKPETRNYLYLDPTMPKEGEKIARWRLIDNLGDDLRGDLE